MGWFFSHPEKEPEIKELDFDNFASAYNSIIKTENPRSSVLIIDIDGVLLEEIDFLILIKGLYYFLFRDRKKFKDFVNEHKIPLKYLRMLIILANKGFRVILLTNRFIKPDSDYFPFLSEETIAKFKEKGITVISYNKLRSLFDRRRQPEEIRDLIEGYNVYYLGSGIFDKDTALKIAPWANSLTFCNIGKHNKLI